MKTIFEQSNGVDGVCVYENINYNIENIIPKE
jgi:hypothetical protein